MFNGLSAFPITPFKNEAIDFDAFEKIVDNLVDAKVDSICAMGSTGLYPYLKPDEIFQVAKKTVEIANDVPVMAGVGALRTEDVLKNVEAAQRAGVSAVLLAPVSYHPLNDQEVFSLYEKVTQELSVPLCVYENPRVTQFTFSDDLYKSITQLPNVGAIKIPGMPFATDEGNARLAQLRAIVPSTVAIGVSGDQFGAAGMQAGCDLWLSVLGGLFPRTVQRLMSGSDIASLQQKLTPMWQCFVEHKGGLRVMATAATILGYSESNCLPSPLLPVSGEHRDALEKMLNLLALD